MNPLPWYIDHQENLWKHGVSWASTVSFVHPYITQ